jgi:hypothetical protein
MKNRKSNRLKGYDYSKNNLYFVTNCVKNNLCCLGRVISGGTGRDLSVHHSENRLPINHLSENQHSINHHPENHHPENHHPINHHRENQHSENHLPENHHPINHHRENQHSENQDSINHHPENQHSENHHFKNHHRENQHSENQHSENHLPENHHPINHHRENQHSENQDSVNHHPENHHSINHYSENHHPENHHSINHHPENQHPENHHSENQHPINQHPKNHHPEKNDSNFQDSDLNYYVELNQYGLIVEEKIIWLMNQYPYVDIHNYIVMPNHFHLILEIDSVKCSAESLKIKSLSSLIGALKTTSSKEIHLKDFDTFEWHRSFHDHIIKDEKSYNNIFNYITNNPSNWQKDSFYHKV